jgi:hypothetical protein
VLVEGTDWCRCPPQTVNRMTVLYYVLIPESKRDDYTLYGIGSTYGNVPVPPDIREELDAARDEGRERERKIWNSLLPAPPDLREGLAAAQAESRDRERKLMKAHHESGRFTFHITVLGAMAILDPGWVNTATGEEVPDCFVYEWDEHGTFCDEWWFPDPESALDAHHDLDWKQP